MSLQIKQLGRQDYQTTWQAMRDYTDQRDDSSDDQIWIVEHPPVLTQGLNGKAEHLLQAQRFQQHNIAVVQTDRGGQVTYHAPGQLVLYVLVDLKRHKLGVRALVSAMEQSIIDYLSGFAIEAQARTDAPGVYVNGDKIASLGLKIRKHKSYHGLALNLDMDLTPFEWVNPCGLQGMKMTQLSDFTAAEKMPTLNQAGETLANLLAKRIIQPTP
ncbi:lipoyl(octanoyl) transferase LipB [Thiomicrorhabdus sediminis]|uniref:Octanoyltransferase n=1 Tax=Thiomicrorhabdus sediminis TaxID=2580412 RepID=A0A4P9K446_9GAMM|nr:lipoyl(octanoyl) transferase LipB [Thiomicrorhabdus sediminis]QCU89682.1 lipoyl(octanoyl) transferase LipB [Thiomicrorhabdus sediminis]